MFSRSEDVEVHALFKRGWSISAMDPSTLACSDPAPGTAAVTALNTEPGLWKERPMMLDEIDRSRKYAAEVDRYIRGQIDASTS